MTPLPTIDDPRRRRRVRAVLGTVGGLACGVFLVGAILLATSVYQLIDAVRETQVAGVQRAAQDRLRDNQTADTADDAASAAARIEECTTPGRGCFEDAQRRLGRTVGTINRYALAAAACADQPRQQSIDEIQDCIIAEISANQQPQEKRP